MEKVHTYKQMWFSTLTSFFLIVGLAGSLALAVEKPQFQIIQQNGTLFQQKGKEFIALKKDQKPDGTSALRIGETIDPAMIQSDPKALNQMSLVISFGKDTLLTLSNSSTVLRTISKKKFPEYNLTGAVHLFIRKQEESTSSIQFTINGYSFTSATDTHLFYNQLGTTPELTVIEGETSALFPFPATVDVSSDAKKRDSKVELKEIILKPFSRVILKKNETSIIEGIKLENDPIYQAATIPGFEVNGAYRKAGFAVFSSESLRVTRFGKPSLIKYSPAALMEGDEIKTDKEQTATLYLDSKDDVRLSPESVFNIEQFSQEEKESTLSASFSGKVRARIAKRPGASNIRFKTVTAVIGVKGTDFEATATAESSEVATVEGEVGVADAAGNGEVAVKAGMMTSVAAGALPEAPKPIPPDRFQKLNEDAIPLNDANLVELKRIKFISPLAEKTYARPILALDVEPENASWQALLDEKNCIIRNGEPFINLAEGTHQLTIRGIGKDAVFETIRFTSDQTAPSPTNLSDSFVLRQGTPLAIIWSEPVEKLTITYDGKPFDVKLSNDRKGAGMNSDMLFQKSDPPKPALLSFKVSDAAGNESSFEKIIALKFKPDKPPLITIGDGKPLFITRALDRLKVTADRPIEKWDIMLDGQTIPSVGSGDENKPELKKNELLLQLAGIKIQEKETHLLVVQATDDFNLTGSQNLEIKIDPIPPVLAEQASLLNPLIIEGEQRQLTLNQLFVKEGESLRFQWNEPLATVIVKIENRNPLPLILTTDQMASDLRSEEIRKAFTASGFKKITLTASDLAGNITESQGKLFYKARPVELPAILIGKGEASLLFNQAPSLTLKATRELFQWKIVLNGQELNFLSEEEKKAGGAKQQIVLKPDLFSGIEDGLYKLMVFAHDDFLLPASQELSFTLDRNSPLILNLPEGVRFNKLKLEKGGALRLDFNERIYRLEATLDKKSWPLNLEADGTRLVLNGNPERLDYTPKPYRIALYDKVNNILELQGTVALRLPRWQELKENHDSTILLSTGDPLDQMVLTNRPDFKLNNAAVDSSLTALSRTGKSVFSEKFERVPESLREEKKYFSDSLEDPLANDFRLDLAR